MTENLPAPIATYFAAADADEAARDAAFAADAIAVDEGKVYRGRAEIAAWRNRSIVGTGVTYGNLRAQVRGGETMVTAEIDGNFDRTGLPDPLDLNFHFVLRGDEIVTLVVVLAKKPSA